jgi:signal transduction histidine kinase
MVGRIGLPNWVLVLLFAGYNGVLGLLRLRVRWLRSRVLGAIVDFVLATALYSVAASPGGAMFILVLLATVWAAATVSLRQSLVHTIGMMLAVTAIAPTLPKWVPGAISLSIRDMLARLIILALASTTTALLVRRIEQEHRAAQSSRADAERQTELNRLTGVFISSVSHDLRTPLTALRSGLGMLEMSAGDHLDADERQLLAAARRNSERLGLLIDDLLTYNQLEAHALQLAPAPLRLDAVAAGAADSLRPLLEEKRQRLVLDLPASLPCSGDARRMEQVVVNLVANAHYHTPPGTTVRLSGAITGHEVLLTIEDNGPGVPPGKLAHLFERFSRPASSDGSGLGLAIAKSIVELHGGRIWAHSGSACGTLMHVALPLPLDTIPDEVSQDVPAPAHSGRYA